MPDQKGGQFTSISIPTTIYTAIQERLEGTEFTSVESYVAYVMSEVLSDDDVQTFSEEDEVEVKKRLRDLGYID